MKIKKSHVIFNNVLSVQTKCKKDEWSYDVQDLRNAVIKSGLYGTGPIIYKILNYDKETDETEYTFYLPISAPIELKNEDKFKFYEKLDINEALLLQHVEADDEMEEANVILKQYAEANGLVLEEPFYNIYIDVYGDGLIDVCAPIIKKVNNND